MLPLVHNVVVNKKQWLTEEEMVDCLAIAQSIPGAVIINTATYIGRKVKSFPGSLAATLGVILPSFICIILFVSILGYIGDNHYINGFFRGALAAASGLVAVTVVKMGKVIYEGPADIVIAVIVFALVVIFDINIVWIILGSIPLGFIIFKVRQRIKKKKGGDHSHE